MGWKENVRDKNAGLEQRRILKEAEEYCKNTPRWDLIPLRSVARVARVMLDGLKTHKIDDWKDVPPEEHSNRMMEHWINFVDTNNPEELDHFLARAILVHALLR